MRAAALAILLVTFVALAAPQRMPAQSGAHASARWDVPEVTAGASPPVQPASGPGGREYPFAGVRRRVGGAGAEQYWIFEPADPVPARAPVVVFLHGWGAMVPDPYLGWIQHLVRRGNIVIYPRYQESLSTRPASMTDHAEAAVKTALEDQARHGRVRPDLEYVAYVGHSLGGVIAANLAARAASGEGPVPKALMVVQPGDPPRTSLAFARSQPSILEDYRRIAPQTLMLVVVGDHDRTVGEETARIIFREAGVAPPNKNYVILRSDHHGNPPLVADHYAPTALVNSPDDPAASDGVAPVWAQEVALRLFGLVTGQPDVGRRVGPPDALDYYGFWKLFDALTDAAFYYRHREIALGDTPEQRFMGTWSDGVPVRPAVVWTSLPGEEGQRAEEKR